MSTMIQSKGPQAPDPAAQSKRARELRAKFPNANPRVLLNAVENGYSDGYVERAMKSGETEALRGETSDAVSRAAESDWSTNRDGVRDRFESKAGFVAYRRAVAAGRISVVERDTAPREDAAQPALPTAGDPESQRAAWEQDWNTNKNGLRSQFRSKDAFLAYRKAVAEGRVGVIGAK